jgi:hypothetical protein
VRVASGDIGTQTPDGLLEIHIAFRLYQMRFDGAEPHGLVLETGKRGKVPQPVLGLRQAARTHTDGWRRPAGTTVRR